MVKLLNQRELAGVLAHEISHLSNDDMRVLRLADLAGRLSGWLSLCGQLLLLINLPLILFAQRSVDWLLVVILILAPQVNLLAQLGLSRVREFSADLEAAALTDDPEGLALALTRIQRRTDGLLRRMLSRYVLPHWLRTHPPTEERVARLMQLTGRERGERFRADFRPGTPGSTAPAAVHFSRGPGSGGCADLDLCHGRGYVYWGGRRHGF